MTQNEAKLQLRLTVSAVIAHLRIPARLLAELGPACCIEIDPEDAATPILTLEVQGRTIARGYAKEHDGRLTATIFWTGYQPSDRQFDTWTLKRELATDGASEDRDRNKRGE